mmetsp:Transcript_26694/g.77678  ORF Transcript_26694/g.77678 Transcript_26694/m.77678 type:complete len:112 (-) Transcript_26694:105-440(-)
MLITKGLFYNVMTGDGVAVICGGGAIVEKELAAGEMHGQSHPLAPATRTPRGEASNSRRAAPPQAIVIDTSSLLAWEPSVQLEVRRAGGCLMCCCGGEGLFLNRQRDERPR